MVLPSIEQICQILLDNDEIEVIGMERRVDSEAVLMGHGFHEEEQQAIVTIHFAYPKKIVRIEHAFGG